MMGSILGMLEPTSGSVTVEGMDSRMHIQDVRRILGFCPQYGEIGRYNTEMNDFYGYFRYSL
jgi:ABC-type multidrug transport system ATPase subunit